jgi:pSer/pThr/pTyr-binding forkhead associated (FHA) protein
MGIEQAVPASAPLLTVRAPGSDRILRAGPPYAIGRDPGSDIVVAEGRVSWQHAVLRFDGDSWVLEDIGSTNGTFLGAQRVQRIALGEEITVRLAHPVDEPVLTCSTAEPPGLRTVVAARPAMRPTS